MNGPIELKGIEKEIDKSHVPHCQTVLMADPACVGGRLMKKEKEQQTRIIYEKDTG